MGKIIAIANQKGGVGKSTTAINLSAAMAARGHKILVIDMDPQGNTTNGLGIDKNSLESSIYEVLIGEATAKESVITTKFDDLAVIPASTSLAGAEIELIDLDDREGKLVNAIGEIKDEYEYILVDCPPSLSVLTLNAMTAADSVLIPIQCEYYALEGLTQILETLDLIKERLNENLEIEGIVFTMFDSRTNLSLEVVSSVRENLDAPVFETLIPRNVRLAEAPSYGVPVNYYDKSSAGSVAYDDLAAEILKEERKEEHHGKKKWSWKRFGFYDSEQESE